MAVFVRSGLDSGAGGVFVMRRKSRKRTEGGTEASSTMEMEDEYGRKLRVQSWNLETCSDHRANAAVLGFGAAAGLRGCRWRGVVVGGVGGVRGVTPVAVACVRRVQLLLACRRR